MTEGGIKLPPPHLFIQKVTPSGALAFPAPGIAVNSNHPDQYNVGILSSWNQGIIVLWGQGAVEDDSLYVQCYNQQGMTLWDDTGVLVSTRLGRVRTDFTSDGRGGIIVVWDEIGLGSSFGDYAQQISRHGNLGEVILITIPATESLPKRIVLTQSFPNPFNPSTTIPFSLPQNIRIRLIVYDIVGREIVNLVDGWREGGYHSIVWEGKSSSGSSVPSGIYIARLVTPEYSQSIKMVLLK